VVAVCSKKLGILKQIDWVKLKHIMRADGEQEELRGAVHVRHKATRVAGAQPRVGGGNNREKVYQV